MTRQLDRSKKQLAGIRRSLGKREKQISSLQETVRDLQAQIRQCAASQKHYAREIARLRQQLKYEDSDFD